MSKRDPFLLVKDIVIAATRILEYTKGLDFDGFTTDQKTVDAVVRNFEIIGEASNQISDEFKQTNNSVSWRDLSDFRNRLIHEYFGVDLEIVWEIVSTELNQLIDNLNAME